MYAIGRISSYTSENFVSFHPAVSTRDKSTGSLPSIVPLRLIEIVYVVLSPSCCEELGSSAVDNVLAESLFFLSQIFLQQ